MQTSTRLHVPCATPRQGQIHGEWVVGGGVAPVFLLCSATNRDEWSSCTLQPPYPRYLLDGSTDGPYTLSDRSAEDNGNCNLIRQSPVTRLTPTIDIALQRSLNVRGEKYISLCSGNFSNRYVGHMAESLLCRGKI
jgi:hypothetical protein